MNLKSILLMVATLLASSSAFAISTRDLSGGYLIGLMAIEGPFYAVEFKVNSAGTSLIFRDGNMDSVRKNSDCTGGFEISGDIVSFLLREFTDPFKWAS